jgi:hypothetical protein
LVGRFLCFLEWPLEAGTMDMVIIMVRVIVIVTVILVHTKRYRMERCTTPPLLSDWMTGSALIWRPVATFFFLEGPFVQAGRTQSARALPSASFRVTALHSFWRGLFNWSLAYQAADESKVLYSTPEPEPLATRCSLSWGRASRFGPKEGLSAHLGTQPPPDRSQKSQAAGCDNK